MRRPALGHARVDIGLANQPLHAVDLRLQHVEVQPHGGLVVHRMVAQLVARGDDLAQHLLAALDLAANDKQRGMRVVVLEELDDLARVLGRRVVDGEGDELGRRGGGGGGGQGHFPEDVGPAVLEVADQEARRAVDDIEGQEEHEGQREQEEQRRHAVAAGAALDLGGQAEQRGEADHVMRRSAGSWAGVERWVGASRGFICEESVRIRASIVRGLKREWFFFFGRLRNCPRGGRAGCYCYLGPPMRGMTTVHPSPLACASRSSGTRCVWLGGGRASGLASATRANIRLTGRTGRGRRTSQSFDIALILDPLLPLMVRSLPSWPAGVRLLSASPSRDPLSVNEMPMFSGTSAPQFSSS